MSTRAVSKLTSKYQTTVPAAVREALCLEKGDALVFEVADDGAVTVRKAVAARPRVRRRPAVAALGVGLGRRRRGLPWPLSSGTSWSCRSRSQMGRPGAAGRPLCRRVGGARQRDRPQRAGDDHERRPSPLAARRAASRSPAAGLPSPSVVRLKIFTLDDRLVERRVGALGPPDASAVASRAGAALRRARRLSARARGTRCRLL